VRPWAEISPSAIRCCARSARHRAVGPRGPEISLEAHVQDLEAVVDAARFERFALLGLSQGAAFPSPMRHGTRSA